MYKSCHVRKITGANWLVCKARHQTTDTFGTSAAGDAVSEQVRFATDSGGNRLLKLPQVRMLQPGLKGAGTTVSLQWSGGCNGKEDKKK